MASSHGTGGTARGFHTEKKIPRCRGLSAERKSRSTDHGVKENKPSTLAGLPDAVPLGRVPRRSGDWHLINSLATIGKSGDQLRFDTVAVLSDWQPRDHRSPERFDRTFGTA